jgi:hypothetical protein
MKTRAYILVDLMYKKFIKVLCILLIFHINSNNSFSDPDEDTPTIGYRRLPQTDVDLERGFSKELTSLCASQGPLRDDVFPNLILTMLENDRLTLQDIDRSLYGVPSKNHQRAAWSVSIIGGAGSSYALSKLFSTSYALRFLTLGFVILPEVIGMHRNFSAIKIKSAEEKARQEEQPKVHFVSKILLTLGTIPFTFANLRLYWDATTRLEFGLTVPFYWLSSFFRIHKPLTDFSSAAWAKLFQSTSKTQQLREEIKRPFGNAYRKMLTMSLEDLLCIAEYLSNLNKVARTEQDRQMATLAILSFFYDFDSEGRFGLKDQSMPTGYRAAQIIGALFGLGGAWGFGLMNYCNAQVNLSNWGVTGNAVKVAGYTFSAGMLAASAALSAYAGSQLSKNLYCQYTRFDVNTQTNDLKFHRQNLSSVRTIVTSLTPVISTFVVLPNLGLCGGFTNPQMIWAILGFGSILNETLGREYQEVINRFSEMPKCSSSSHIKGELRDFLLNYVVSLTKIMDRLPEVSLDMVIRSLKELKAAKKPGYIPPVPEELRAEDESPIGDIELQDMRPSRPPQPGNTPPRDHDSIQVQRGEPAAAQAEREGEYTLERMDSLTVPLLNKRARLLRWWRQRA